MRRAARGHGTPDDQDHASGASLGRETMRRQQFVELLPRRGSPRLGEDAHLRRHKAGTEYDWQTGVLEGTKRLVEALSHERLLCGPATAEPARHSSNGTTRARTRTVV